LPYACKKQAQSCIFAPEIKFELPKVNAVPGMYESSRIISLNIHNLTFQQSLYTIGEWGLQHRTGFVCFANVHMTIEAYKSQKFNDILKKALLVLPDGKPLAVANRWLYGRKQQRISGMDFMPALLQYAAQLSARVFLYGSTEEVLSRLVSEVKLKYPGLVIAGTISPPFRALTEAETGEHIRQINESGAHFVLVALGCPKQEKWMAENYTAINAVLLGLGGAFPVMAGMQKRSPEWRQRLALEWLFRLIQEPRRMFKRYLYTNSLFIWLLLKELFKTRVIGVKAANKTFQP
jgi:N-acetylglucosaminyldiphosphoundecaprenol N-acetyl-beta-D-mannosaminyltransferase